MPRKTWVFRQLRVSVGLADRYGVDVTIDFNYGWGLHLMVWNCYLMVEYWANER